MSGQDLGFPVTASEPAIPISSFVCQADELQNSSKADLETSLASPSFAWGRRELVETRGVLQAQSWGGAGGLAQMAQQV